MGEHGTEPEPEVRVRWGVPPSEKVVGSHSSQEYNTTKTRRIMYHSNYYYCRGFPHQKKSVMRSLVGEFVQIKPANNITIKAGGSPH